MIRRVFLVALSCASLSGCALQGGGHSAELLSIGSEHFHMLTAKTTVQLDSGIRAIRSFGGNDALVFDLPNRKNVSVHMDDVDQDLAVAWVRDSHVVKVDSLKACSNELFAKCDVTPSPDSIDCLIEIPSGRHAQIGIGDSVLYHNELLKACSRKK